MPTQALFDANPGDSLAARLSVDDDIESIDPSVAASPIELSLTQDLTSIEAQWRAFEMRADCTVFQTYDWLATWMRHLGTREGVQPAIVIGQQRGSILFIMPFALDRSGKTIRWLGNSLCNYNGPLLAPDFSARVDAARFAQLWREVRRLLRSHFGHDLIDLEKMPETIGHQRHPFLALGVTPHMNNAYITRLGPDWETYYAEKRSSSTRRTDRKKRRKLEESGVVTFATASGEADITRTLDALIDEKQVSYAKLGVDNMFARDGYRDFFLAMATGATSAPLTHLSRLEIDGHIIAANFGIPFRDTYIYLLAGYEDGDYTKLGPGAMLLMEIMQHAMASGTPVFDFTIGDEPYKRDWSEIELKLYDHVAPATLKGALTTAPMFLKREIKRRIRQNQKVWAVVRAARKKVSAMRRG